MNHLVGDVDARGDFKERGSRSYVGTLLSAQFLYEPKTALKNKLY